MFLKSEGAASSLSDPNRVMTLAHYCVTRALPYQDHTMPIPLETFVNYGLTFQQQLVPDVEEHRVVFLAEKQGSFELQLDTGARVTAGQVVVAVGTGDYFKNLPSEFAGLPGELVSHSGDHSHFTKFAGREVIVVGGGQSALETAALLYERGAKVRILMRRPKVVWTPDPSPATRHDAMWRLTQPSSSLGLGWKAWFYSNRPGVFQYLPSKFRSAVVRRALGPAGAWWLKERVEGRVPVLCGRVIRKAWAKRNMVFMSVACLDGTNCEMSADHLIAATGYRVDIRSLSFLDAKLLQKLRSYDAAPVLSSGFESSVPGLYFAGVATAKQFGPAMRFVAGVEYAARKITNACKDRGN
jgi:cation diffusion facilitator CzcD-associated flavoprotein CzcO